MGLKEKFEKETRGDDDNAEGSSQSSEVEVEVEESEMEILKRLGSGGTKKPLCHRSISLSAEEIASDLSKIQSEASGSGTSTFLANDDAAMRRSSESSLPQSSMAYGGVFAAFARGNNLFSSIIQPAGQGTPMAPIGSSYFPQGQGIQVAESSNTQPVMRNQYPTRFGISQADQLGTRQSGHYQQYQAPNVQHPMSFPSGQGIPRASNIHGRPPLGRTGLERYLPGWSRVRPRTIPRPSAPPALPPVNDQAQIPSSLQPSGEQCWLCKRDIKFAPDGPLSLLAMPPVVAVLSCHHVFHAQCLENITPEDQEEDPPCILCAIREP